MKKQTLVEQAKSIPNRVKSVKWTVIDEEIDLIVEWLADRVTLYQISKVIGVRYGTNAYTRIALVVREAYRRGKIKKAY